MKVQCCCSIFSLGNDHYHGNLRLGRCVLQYRISINYAKCARSQLHEVTDINEQTELLRQIVPIIIECDGEVMQLTNVAYRFFNSFLIEVVQQHNEVPASDPQKIVVSNHEAECDFGDDIAYILGPHLAYQVGLEVQ